MIGGLILLGTKPQRVIVGAIMPSLRAAGVTNPPPALQEG
jgi:hypothetical protein